MLKITFLCLTLLVCAAATHQERAKAANRKISSATRATLNAKPKAADTAALRGSVSTNSAGNNPGMYVMGTWWDRDACGGRANHYLAYKAGACQEVYDENDMLVGHEVWNCWTDNNSIRNTMYSVDDPTCMGSPSAPAWLDGGMCMTTEGSEERSNWNCMPDPDFLRDWDQHIAYVVFPTRAQAEQNEVSQAIAWIGGEPTSMMENINKKARVKCNTDMLPSGECVNAKNVRSYVNVATSFTGGVLNAYSRSNGQGEGMSWTYENPVWQYGPTTVFAVRYLVSDWNNYWSM